MSPLFAPQKNYGRIVVLSLFFLFTIVFLNPKSNAQAVNETDSLALVALYNSTDGANWTDNTNWLSGPVSTWYGITVSGDRVTQIQLSSNSLTGSVPTDIGDIESLTKLDLYNNSLSGSIPAELGNLTNLTDLLVNMNSLSGSIPSELGNLTNLENLRLDVNSLSGSIPSELGNLTNLTNLLLSNNFLNGSIPSELGNLMSLTDLGLYYNSLIGSIPSELGNLTNLASLSLHNNSLSGSIPSELGNLTSLSVLYLSSNQLSGGIPSELGNLTNLTSLFLQSNDFTDIPDFSSISTLNYFEIDQNHIEFQPIEDYLSGGSASTFTYAPQKLVDTEENQTANVGGEVTFTTDVSGSANLYQWYKDGSVLSGETDPNLTLSNITNDDAGVYTCQITSEVVTDLTLTTYNKTLTVTDYNIESDSLALVALYNSTDGANWTDNTNWLSGPVSTWYGITVSGDRVSEIGLYDNALDGTIPSELGNLSSLTGLYINTNSLSGEIPAELGNLSNLTVLNLCENSLSGSVPTSLGDLTNLAELYLHNNNLTGSVPSQLGSLSNLTNLHMHQNSLSGSIPDALGSLSILEELFLYNNSLSGEIPSAIGSLTSLTHLYLYNNSLTGSVPAELGNMTSLEYLYLQNNSLSGNIPAELSGLSNLIRLYLADNQLSGSVPSELGNLTTLTDLSLNNNTLSGSIPAELGNLTNLSTLILYNNDFTDIIPDFSSISTLTSYYIRENHIEFQPIEGFLSGGSSALFGYTPQKLVDTEENQTASVGGEVTFTTDVSGSANLYQWYKDGSVLSGKTDPNLTLSNITNDDAGVYTCQITSEIVTDLTLTTYNKTLEVTEHTIVCGNISEYVTWSTDTVYVNCDVTIMDMGKVTVNPGVRVLFAGPYKIRVEGCLQATGTAADSIWFSPVDTEEGWRGIEIETYSSSEETFFNYCVFEHGKAGYRSSQAYSGGALFIGSSMMEVSCKSSTFRNNYAEDDGGAIYATGTMVKIDRCGFCNNNCLGDGGAVLLGSNAYPITILNSLFANNESAGKGGGAWLEISATGSVFYNNTFAKNNAAYGGGAYFYESSIDVYNSILYANAATQAGIQVGIETSTNTVPNFYYSDIQAGTIGFYLSGPSTYDGTTSNLLDSDPLYTDPAAGPGIMYNGCEADYSLQETSPCINQGDPATSSSLIGDYDIAGNDRFDGASIDQGAYERGGTGPFFVNSQFQFPGLYNGNSVWLDYDNDGDLDIFYQGGATNTYLYENTGTSFVPAELTIDAIENAEVTVCDYNLDNLPDLFLTGGTSIQISVLYQNNGGGYAQVNGTNIMPLNGSAAAWADFDNDGDQDLAICGQDDSYGFHCIVYKNNIESFEVYDELFGLINPAVSWQDIDNDGDQDLLCIGDNGSGTHYAKLYRNDDASFVEMTNNITPLEYPTIDWADFNGDGYMDLITTGQNSNANTQIYLNTSGTGFSAYADGLPDISEGDACFSDFNSDGLVDVFLIGLESTSGYPKQALYLNSGSGFDLEESGVLDVTQASVSVADVNQDGKPDMFVMGYDYDAYSMLYLNDSENANTPPSAPVSPTSNVDGTEVELSWGAGDDAETPVVSLTYNLMLKDQNGELVQSPLSTIANGFRKISGNGSNDLALAKTFSCLPAGTYYWRVQSIDQGFSASAFTEEASFEMPDVINIITQPSNAEVCENGDTLFGLVAEGANLTYQWQVFLEGWEDLQNDDVYQNVNSDTLRIIGAASDITETQYRCKITCDCPGEVFSDEVSLTVNALPAVYNVTGGGSYCAGGTGVEIGLDGSETGVDYTLVIDGSTIPHTISGTGSAISFGDQTVVGDYTITAENTTTSCSSEMTGTKSISIDDNPTAFNVTGGGSYCAGGTGVEIGLDGSETGVEYTLLLDGSPTSTIVSGTGTAISFGDQTAAGDYTVSALNTATSCSSEMTGTKSISIDDNPTAFNVTGGGSYCAGGTGVEIGLDGSETGVEYTLLLDGSPTSTIVSGTGTAISFGDQTAAGDYTVSALNTATSCSSEMTGAKSISIDDNPTAFNVTGGGSYCAGGTGVEIGLDGSETGVDYTLVIDGSTIPHTISGTGSAISFGDQTVVGDYTITAENTTTSCSSEMTGTKSISIDDNPTAFNVTGGGSYCAGGTGVEIGLDGSETGVEYTLLLDGSPTSTIVSGTGTAISFGDQTVAGDYTVSALNTATSCSSEMTGTVAVAIDDNPTAFNVTGGGSYCAGGTGVEIGLDGSESGVEYTLLLDGSPTSTIVSGTGTAISFGDQTTAGDYTVSALNTATSCTSEMTGAVAVTIDDNPTAFNVTGGGSYCAGGTGVEIGLGGSETGVEYTLLLDGSPTSTIVSGTGTAISFGDQTAAGDYTVSALNTATSCSSEMTGTVAISIDDNPTAFNVTGGGSYCAGGTGIEIGLDGSETGVEYTLLLDGSPTSTIVSGTGTAISFGDQTTAGDYTVSALNTATSCSSEMTGTKSISIDDNPTAFNVTGGGSYCAGGTGVEIGLDGSETGVEYTLLLDGSPTSTIVSGTGTAISFGDQTTAGDYTVSALNTATSCTSEMTGAVAVTIDDNPTAFNVTGGGSYCAGGTGVEIGLDGSETGVEYTLLLDGSPTSTIVSGTGSAISFGDQTAAGDYTVSALNTATSCSSEMTGTKSISIDDNPTAFNVTGGGSYCAGGTGVEIGLDGSETGVEYTLLLDGSPTSTIVSGTGTAISFGDQTAAGDYTVSALNTATSCSSEMTGTKSISIDDNPTAFNVTGGGSYCAGGTGVEIGLDGSETGVEYTLLLDGSPTSTIVSGTGTAISFGDQTAAGDYTVSALNTATSCSSEMTGTKSISIDDNPTAFNVTGGGSYCAGGTGVEIGLDGSETGVEYTLLLDGSPTSTIVSGTGTAISFGDQTAAGDYTVSALNTATSCSSEMTGTKSISIDDNPTAFNVTGGGSYCAGGTGVEIGLDGSETGVEYTLLLDGSPTSTIVSGTGTAISFGDQTTAGDYTVSALNTATSCSSEMTGTKSISIDDNPTAFNVTGGGSYCAGGTGVEIGLDGSETGVEYTLLLDGSPTSTIVSGTGTAISFGDQTAAGDYTVSALNTATSCSSEMTGTKSISIDDNPTAFNVTGGGSYCAGGTGIEIGLDGSETGVEYTLLLDGSPTSTIVSGTGTAISFGDQTTAGDYTVSALNSATSCTSEMTGTKSISIDDNPTTFNVTGGGSYCAGGTGVEIGLDGSETGVEYTLLLDGSPTSTIVSGTGTAISFGDQTAAGDYTVSALNTATSCSSEMTGVVAVNIEPLPDVSFSGLASSYCANDDPVLLTGNHAPEGEFTGSGISDNGDGTAWFDPSLAGTGFHNIEYSYTSPTGCTNQQTSTTEVLEIPLVEFTGLDAAYCENAPAVLLTGNQAPDGVFSGNGITDNGDGTAWFDPVVAGVGGPYSITYSYTNPDGCSGENIQEVTVNALPIVSFTGLDASYCQDDEDVLLAGSEAPEGSFTGDGITDNGDGTATLSFAALSPGTDYQVVYSYSDGNSCTGTDTQFWHLNAQPTADFSYDGACFNQGVEFTDLSLANAGSIVSWEWDFGDGATSTDPNPLHQFESGTGPGFDVQLTVVNDLGCSHTLMQHIVISDPPEAGFTFDVDPPCAGNEVLFTDNSIPGSGSITNWMWDLGDGNSTNGQSFTHIYQNEGLYAVELIVLSNTGCSDTITQNIEIHALPDADFDFTNGCPDQMLDFTDLSSITQGSISAWEWDFGDGGTSADQNAQHAYTAPGIYNVQLKVISDQGCEHSVTKPLEIYALPEADFTFGPACSGDDMSFTDQSTGGNYNLVSWMWDFGDGNTSTDQNPIHVFENPGQYDVTLTVSHEFGCSDTKLISVDVHPTPLADFSWEGVCANHTFAFTDESDPVGGNLVSWVWDFGDGTSSTEQNPQHNWLEAGSYEVRLTVSSEDACSSTILQTVNVGYVPEASFTFQGNCAGNATVFTDMSTAQQVEISSWMWDFDDGTTSEEQNPEHVFANEGLFAVWLKVMANNSCADSVQEVVQINPIPALNLGNDTTVCPGGFYLDAGGDFSTYTWSTGASTPGILIEESGWYKLSVADEFGCSTSDSIYVTVLEELQLQGRITTADEVVNSGFVYLYRYEENAASEKIDSALIEYGGYYELFGLNPCDRFIVMAEGDPMFYPDNYPTYYDNVAHWEEATIIDSTFASVDGVISDIDIQLMQYENMGQGAGYLQGFVFYSGGGPMKGREERGEPVKNTDISLEILAEDQKSTDADIFHTTRRTQTDVEGFYMFDFLPTGTFRIVVEIPGLPIDSMYRLTITDTDSVFLDLNYYVDTTSGIYVTPDPSGVEDFVAQQLQLAVRPNPNKGNFTLFFLEEQHQDVWVEEVQIMDMTGSLILHERLAKACRRHIADMHLRDVLPGLYLLNLQTDKGRMMVKMIVR